MTIDEAKAICERLSKINVDIWNSHGVKKQMLVEKFRSEYKSIIDAGFLVRRWRLAGMPMFTPRVDRHKDDVVIATNKPNSLDVKGDCTTRCISFCTGLDYMAIRQEQLHLSKIAGISWKYTSVWEKCLLSRGFARIDLSWRHLSRATFIKLSKTLDVCDGVIATRSSGHVAAIDMSSRKILDSFNSSGGRITTIYVPKHQRDTYVNWLNSVGYPSYAA